MRIFDATVAPLGEHCALIWFPSNSNPTYELYDFVRKPKTYSPVVRCTDPYTDASNVSALYGRCKLDISSAQNDVIWSDTWPEAKEGLLTQRHWLGVRNSPDKTSHGTQLSVQSEPDTSPKPIKVPYNITCNYHYLARDRSEPLWEETSSTSSPWVL